MTDPNLPEQLFDVQEKELAISKFRNDGDYDTKPLILGLEAYMRSIDPTLDTYDPSRQLIAALKMRNAPFLEDSWEQWLAVMAIHGLNS